MGRGKVVLKRIENPTSKQVTFSKRRNGLIKKASELSILCDAEVALVIFSPSGKAYHFASHDMHRTIFKYRSEVGLPHPDTYGFGAMEMWRTEIDELRKSVGNLEARLKHLAGEDLSNLGMKELKQLERQLKTALQRIYSKKTQVNTEDMNMLKRRVRAKQEDNNRLRKRLHELDVPRTSSRHNEVWACDAFQGGIVEDGHQQYEGQNK